MRVHVTISFDRLALDSQLKSETDGDRTVLLPLLVKPLLPVAVPVVTIVQPIVTVVPVITVKPPVTTTTTTMAPPITTAAPVQS